MLGYNLQDNKYRKKRELGTVFQAIYNKIMGKENDWQ